MLVETFGRPIRGGDHSSDGRRDRDRTAWPHDRCRQTRRSPTSRWRPIGRREMHSGALSLTLRIVWMPGRVPRHPANNRRGACGEVDSGDTGLRRCRQAPE